METHLQSLVSYQSRHAEVQVLVANNEPRTQTEVRDGASITRLATFGSIASMPVTPSLFWRLRGCSADVVHIHLPNPAAAAAYLWSGHKGKLILTHHGDTVGRRLLRRVSDPFVQQAMTRAESIIVCSQRYLDSSTELSDFRSKCHVIPLGIDLARRAPVDPLQVLSIRERYGERIVLAMGRLVPYKGFDYLIRALRHTDATLLLIGKGPLLEELRATAVAAGVASRTHFLGYVDDPTPYFHAAQIFALPSISRAESFGLVQLEAMAAGLPVINTDLPSAVPEVSVGGLTGQTVVPCDIESLAEAIRVLLRSESLRQRYGAAARAQSLLFSAESMAERTDEIYRASPLIG
jgi:glycosyltransferase involved in cell wall biosynthesis